MVDKLEGGKILAFVHTNLMKCADFSFCQWRHVRHINPTNYIIKPAL